MNIVVPSIMHSGTHMLRYQILGAFFQDEDCNFNGSSMNKMIGFHVDQRFRFEKELNSLPVFCPMRHPRRIAKSWQARGMLKSRVPYTQKNLNKQWDMLMEIDKLNPIYLHIDNEVRDKEVDLISSSLGIPLVKNWEVCRKSGAVAGNHDIDLDQCPEVPQYQVDFYFKTIERMQNG